MDDDEARKRYENMWKRRKHDRKNRSRTRPSGAPATDTVYGLAPITGKERRGR